MSQGGARVHVAVAIAGTSAPMRISHDPLDPPAIRAADRQADPNCAKVFTARADSPVSWGRALRIAQAALVGTLHDLTKDADHYLNVEATRKARHGTLPSVDLTKTTVVIGNHTFLRRHGD
jgi:hypothetical protein